MCNKQEDNDFTVNTLYKTLKMMKTTALIRKKEEKNHQVCLIRRRRLFKSLHNSIVKTEMKEVLQASGLIVKRPVQRNVLPAPRTGDHESRCMPVGDNMDPILRRKMKRNHEYHTLIDQQ